MRRLIPGIALVLFVTATAACAWPGTALAGTHALSLVSTGPTGGNGSDVPYYNAISADGSRTFFTTQESLVPEDGDGYQDVYERSGNTTTLISTGPSGGNGPQPAIFRRVSADGRHVFFETSEKLTSDGGSGVYERTGNETKFVGHVSLGGVSADGSHIFLETFDRLDPADTDDGLDVYERVGSTNTLISGGSTMNLDPRFFGSGFLNFSTDFSRVLFQSNEPHTSGDNDASWDIYEWMNGTVSLVSTGPSGGSGGDVADAFFFRATDDGGRVFFKTFGRLVEADRDNQYDLYERAGGATTLVSTSPGGGNGDFPAVPGEIAADGTRVLFTTKERLVAGDTDQALDVYERSAGTTTLISTGPTGGNGNFDADFADVSSDGTHVFFKTHEPLFADDIDGWSDVYERTGGVTMLISTGPADDHSVPFGSALGDASADGTRVFFTSGRRLVSSDTDNAFDLYLRGGAQDDPDLHRSSRWKRQLRRGVPRGDGERLTGLLLHLRAARGSRCRQLPGHIRSRRANLRAPWLGDTAPRSAGPRLPGMHGPRLDARYAAEPALLHGAGSRVLAPHSWRHGAWLGLRGNAGERRHRHRG
jgi:hypothetical protein